MFLGSHIPLEMNIIPFFSAMAMIMYTSSKIVERKDKPEATRPGYYKARENSGSVASFV